MEVANVLCVTSNLGAARELAGHVDRLLQGYEEIEEELHDA